MVLADLKSENVPNVIINNSHLASTINNQRSRLLRRYWPCVLMFNLLPHLKPIVPPSPCLQPFTPPKEDVVINRERQHSWSTIWIMLQSPSRFSCDPKNSLRLSSKSGAIVCIYWIQENLNDGTYRIVLQFSFF
jgi:hypothetical protein